MDITFWAIQAVLLLPVVFMAASAGIEESRGKPHPSEGDAFDADDVAAEWARVPVAAGSLSQFTAEQQAHLLILRRQVQEARLGRGVYLDDVLPSAPPRRRRLSTRQILFAGGSLLLILGVAGVVRTSIAMRELQGSSTAAVGSLSPAAEYLPGFIADPGKYLSALNGGGGSSGANSDLVYAYGMLNQKQAMDRWEALVGLGLSLLLLVNIVRPSASSSAVEESDEESSVALDLAPFVGVASVLFVALSFFEIP